MFKLLSILILIIMSIEAESQENVFTNKEGVALSGYDVVAYHVAHEAIRGSVEYTAEHQGVNYYFNNADNREAFIQSPEAYLPKFGGYCAFAMAMQGTTIPSDPQTFKLYNGELYLFYNDYYQGKPFNTIIPWNQDESKLLSQARENWKKL